MNNHELSLRLRSHLSVIAADVLRMRRELEADIATYEGHAIAVAAFAAGMDELQRLAEQLQDGAMPAVKREVGASFGDLVDGELITAGRT